MFEYQPGDEVLVKATVVKRDSAYNQVQVTLYSKTDEFKCWVREDLVSEPDIVPVLRTDAQAIIRLMEEAHLGDGWDVSQRVREQVYPPIEEPTEPWSVVQARTDTTSEPVHLVRDESDDITPWRSLKDGTVWGWRHLSDVVLVHDGGA